MGVQAETCWRCGAAWTAVPEAALRVIEGGAAQVVRQPEVAQVSTAERLTRLVAEARA
jgi:hypothetical protein